MGVVNNEHRITKLEEGGGGGGLVTRIEVLEEDVEHLVSYKEEEVAIGEWVDGSTIYRKVLTFADNFRAIVQTWVDTNFSFPNDNKITNCYLVGIWGGTPFIYRINNGLLQIYSLFDTTYVAGTKLVVEYTKTEE